MGKKYALLQRKVENLESQLIPILTTPPDPKTRPAHHPIPEGINQQLHFIGNLLTNEIALSPASDQAHRCHLAQIACRVRLLQSTLRKWAGVRPTSTLIAPRSASVCSCSESCLADEDEDEDEDVEDDDHGEAEESPMLGFTVYDNPEFFGTVDCDVHDNDDDDYLEFVDGDNSYIQDDDDQNDVGVYDAINQEEEEEEVIEIDNQKEESREKTEDEEEDDMEEYDGIDEEEEQEKIRVRAEKEERRDNACEDEEREHNCCFRVIFGIIMIVMGFIFLMIGFCDFSDHHQPVVFLTPT